MPTKNEFSLPLDNPDFLKDLRDTFRLSDDDIIKLTQEIKTKGDSFNSVSASNLIETDIGSIETYKGVTLYVNHLLHAHNVNLEDIKKQMIEIGLDKNKAQSYTSELSKINEQEKAKIESLYQASIIPQDLYVADIDY